MAMNIEITPQSNHFVILAISYRKYLATLVHTALLGKS